MKCRLDETGIKSNGMKNVNCQKKKLCYFFYEVHGETTIVKFTLLLPV